MKPLVEGGISLNEKAKDPEATPEALLQLAERYPTEVLQNPSLPLLALESPQLWSQIQQKAHEAQLQQSLFSYYDKLSPKSQQQWRFDCAMHALAHYAPNEDTPELRRAKELAEAYQKGIAIEPSIRAGESAQLQMRANDLVVKTRNSNVSPEEKALLYKEAALLRAVDTVIQMPVGLNFQESAVLAASYFATAAGLDPAQAALSERQWQLDCMVLLLGAPL